MTDNTTNARAFEEALKQISAQEWLTETNGDPRAQNRSNTGVFFKQDLVREGYNEQTYGGFFPSIDSTNLNDSIHALFADDEDKGQWLIDYIEKGQTPETKEQQIFVEAYDRLMVGMLDPRVSPENEMLTPWFFADSSRGGETLTDKEFSHLIHTFDFDKDIEKMGDDLGKKWLGFAGGAIQGTMDIESKSERGAATRYSTEEVEALYSPNAHGALKEATKSSIIGFTPEAEQFEALVGNMNSACATIQQSWNFDAGDIPNNKPESARQK